ncbi:MAG: T9SS type A sorting domain-containing protein [Bacteroidota bacterium]|nr:T9SS type A sorting domain-containing protein [Bacteroidota bacterium]
MRRILLVNWCILQLVCWNVFYGFSQTTIINPNTDGGFELGTTFVANGWIEVNGTQTNKWYCGTAATGFTGARAAYVGTAAINNTYDINAISRVHFYKDVVLPAGQPNITLSFSWKGFGEGNFDYIRVYMVSTATAITAGNLVATGQLGGNFNLSTNWQSGSVTFPCSAAGTTQRLVFSWINDGSIGTFPAGAIDNIRLQSAATSSCNTVMGTGVINVASIPYNSGPGTTCGQGNNLTASNTAVCGSTNYLTGEDQVWVFTPTTTGSYSFVLNAPSASFTGLMLYQGCPVGICAAPAGFCVASSQSFSGDKSFCAPLTAGVTYYLVLDSWAAPACNNYNNLSITSASGGTCASLLGTGVINVPSLPYNSGSGTTCGAINNLTATNTAVCGSTNYLTGEDQVFIFTPAASGQVTIILDAPSAAYTGLMLYNGCPVGGCGPGPGACVAFVQDFAGSKSFCANVTAGVTYYLVLDSWAAPACNSYNFLSISSVSSGNPGPTCANAVSIPSLPYSVSGQTTACMGNDYLAGTPGICNGGFASGEDIVYSFTVSSAQCIGIYLSGASNNGITYSVYQGGCPGAGGTCIASGAGATLGSLSGSVNLPGAGTYYLIIDSQNPFNNVSFNLAINSFGAGAANDRPYQAQPLPFNIPIGGNNSCSGNADEPAAQPGCFAPSGSNTMNTVWYSFTAPVSGCVKIRTSLGTLANTQIAVYGPVSGLIAAGSGNTLALVGCNQDVPPCGLNTYPSSQLTLSGLTATMTYYIMVDGFASMTGSFTIYLMDAGVGCNLPFPPTPGQDCELAFPVCKTNINVANPGPQAVGSNCEFTSGVNCLASGERGSYWYTINIIANGFLEFDIVPNDWPGPPSTFATDYDFAVWSTKTAGLPGPANCNNLGSVAPISCNYSALGVTGCFGPTNGTSPAAYPGFGAAYMSRIAVTAGDQYLLNVSNFSNSTSGFALNFSAGTPLATAPPAGGTLVWTGTLSTDWYNPENWGGCATPNCVLNVSIPSIPVNQPAIVGISAVCGSLDVTLGATLTLQPNSQLKICNNLINNGTITALANSTVLMQSDSVLQNQSMSGGMTATNRLWNLVINKPVAAGGNTVTTNNDLDNEGNFTLGTAPSYTGGTFNVNGKIHRVGGNFTVYYAALPYGNYIPAGGTLEFNGIAAQNYFNRGTLFNVVMNHTSTGVLLGNSGAIDWMTIGGTLTLNQGKIITGLNRVNIINPVPTASTPGNISSFVEGYLLRSFAVTGGAYDFPVGTAVKGYQRLNLNFGGFNDRLNALINFNNTAPPTPLPFLGPECVSALYDQAPLNNGLWQVVPLPATGTAPYAVTAYNAGYTNAQSGYTVMTRYDAAPWGLNGTCVAGSPVTALERTGLTAMAASTQFATAQSLTPLPVELIHFDAYPKEQVILLNWITASEIENHGFEIWRATTPPDFNYLGWSEGKGTTSTTNEYYFEDADVTTNTSYYYKLKQVDFNGVFTYTDVVLARLSSKGFTVSAMPNPYMGTTNITVHLTMGAMVNVSVFSALGQEVLIWENKDLEAGIHNFEFGAVKYGLGKGVYTARVQVDGETHYLRLLELD